MKMTFVLLLSVYILIPVVYSGVPTKISYQGRLTDSAGNPVNGVYPIQFAIYTSSGGGTYVWEETQANVSVSDGYFTVLLGSLSPIPDSIFDTSTRYLGVKIASDPEQLPRTQMVTVPWSFRTATVDGASGGNITTKVSIGPNHINTGEDAFIAGASNTISGARANIGGGWLNNIEGGGSVIAGGERNYCPGSYTTISGGLGNQVDGTLGTISGGDSSRVYFDGVSATISGGHRNVARKTCSVVGGGRDNQANDRFSVVSGGFLNIADSSYTTIGGGDENIASASEATVAGGYSNIASGYASTIAGGFNNDATGSRASVGGGVVNKATGDYSTVPGGFFNEASGRYSFAAGNYAKALHEGCFVWHDGTDEHDHTSSAPNQFVVYATGNILFYGSGIKSKFGAGNNTPITAGSYYTDNSIVAWGKVSANGSISTNEFGVTSVVRNSAGNYTVTVDATASAAANLIPTANAELDAAPNSAASIRIVTINQVSTNSFDVYINNGSFTPTDNDFVFIVTAR